MINQKKVSNKYYNNSKIVEKFANRDAIDKFLNYLPFFIKWPLRFYYSIFKKGLKNPVYLGILFVWFVFLKKTVRTNLEDTYRYKY